MKCGLIGITKQCECGSIDVDVLEYCKNCDSQESERYTIDGFCYTCYDEIIRRDEEED
jgi:hypothetical protein